MKPTREIYRQEYRGVTVEVSRHFQKDWRTEQDKDVWCFYLFLAVEMFPEEFHVDLWQPIKFTDFGTPMQPYAECLQDLDWHSGMTWYSKESNDDFPFRSIKAGCDYNHLWDENCYYDAESVMRDAKRCVDSLFQKFPTLKINKILWDEHRAKFKGIDASEGKGTE